MKNTLQLLALSSVTLVSASSSALWSNTTTTTSSASSTSSVASIPSASLCPAVDGTTITGSDGLPWTVKCASDSWTGAYGEADTQTSYLGCMAICDAQPNNECYGFTYQNNNASISSGLGVGKCWLKSSIGAYKSAPGNYIVASKPQPSSSSASSTLATSTSSASASASATGISCPAWNGLNYTTTNGDIFVVECNVDHAGAGLTSFSSTNLTQCIETCASTASCVDATLSMSRCWLKSSLTSTQSSSGVYGARLLSKPSNATTTA